MFKLRWAVKTCEISRENKGGSSNVTQQTTVAVEGPAFLARLTSIRFFCAIFEILRERAWTAWWALPWRKDVLEAGESCGDLNHRQGGEGQADHTRKLCGETTDRDRGDLRCHGTPRIVAPTLRHRALAVGPVIRRYSTGDVRNVR
jgi:hypothetical protein